MKAEPEKRRKPKAIFLHGPSGVGKSSLGELLAKKYGYVHVNAAPFKHNFSSERSKTRTEIGEILSYTYAIELITRRFNVIIEDVERTHARILRGMMKRGGYRLDDITLYVPVEQCIKNDKKRKIHSYGETVIREVYNRYFSKRGYIVDTTDKSMLAVFRAVDRYLKSKRFV